MKVHVTLHRHVHSDPVLREKTLAHLSQECGLQLANRERFERYGIVTGEVDPERLHRLTTLSGLESVELDIEAGLA